MNRPSLKICWCAAALCACLGVPARAGDEPYQIMDPGVEDVSGAAFGMRNFAVDLSPNGFLRTYKVPGRNDLVMRTNGALYAVFDESQYKRDPRYKKVIVYQHAIPANTTFYIGKPNFAKIRSTGIRAVNLRVEHERAPIETTVHVERIPGVQRVEPKELGEQLEIGHTQRVSQRLEPRVIPPVHMESEDISYPPLARRAARSPAQQPPRDPARQPAPERQASGTDSRIDELMRRASKDS